MPDVGLVLAAGAGTRFGQPKAPIMFGGERLVDRSVRVLREAGCDDVVVVLGAWIGTVPKATIVVNDDWRKGMGSSLQTGLQFLGDVTNADRAVVTLVDLPGLTPEAVHEVCRNQSGLVVATYDGQPGHPVILGCEHWLPILTLGLGDEGARKYLASRDDVVRVEVASFADGGDLDHPDSAN